MSSASEQQQQQRRAAVGKRTGRPKRLQPPAQSFLPLPPSAQPQPIELACLVYHYLSPLYPATAESLLTEAAATLPALSALMEQRAVPLQAVVAEWMHGKQRQWDERRLVALLDGLEQRPHEEQKVAGDGGPGDGLLRRTVSTVVQLLADYSTLRQSQQQQQQQQEEEEQVTPLTLAHSLSHAPLLSAHPSHPSVPALACCADAVMTDRFIARCVVCLPRAVQRLSSVSPSNRELLFPSSRPPPAASARSLLLPASERSAAAAGRPAPASASNRKRKTPSSHHPIAPATVTAAAPPPPHSQSSRSGSSGTARGLSALFSSSASPSPPPSSASPQSPFAPSSPLGSPALYPLADYLLHIDADELAGNLDFAEQLAQHINDRLLHAAHSHHSNDSSGHESAAQPSSSDDAALPSRSPSAMPLSTSASSALSAPTRLPSLLSSTGARQWSAAAGGGAGAGGGGGGGAELSLPQLTESEFNLMLDELITTTALAEAVVVEGPAVQRMDEEEAEEQEEGRERKEEAIVDEGEEVAEDATTATPRMLTVTPAATSPSERPTNHYAPPQRRQQTNTHRLSAVSTPPPATLRPLRRSPHLPHASCCVQCRPSALPLPLPARPSPSSCRSSARPARPRPIPQPTQPQLATRWRHSLTRRWRTYWRACTRTSSDREGRVRAACCAELASELFALVMLDWPRLP